MSVNASVAPIVKYCGSSGCDKFMNCGTTASRNTVPLGLTTLIIQARRIMERRLTNTPESDGATMGRAGARHCAMPSHTRYATPSHLTTVNAVLDAATSAPKPTPTISNWVQMPSTRPKMVT